MYKSIFSGFAGINHELLSEDAEFNRPNTGLSDKRLALNPSKSIG